MNLRKKDEWKETARRRFFKNAFESLFPELEFISEKDFESMGTIIPIVPENLREVSGDEGIYVDEGGNDIFVSTEIPLRQPGNERPADVYLRRFGKRFCVSYFHSGDVMLIAETEG